MNKPQPGTSSSTEPGDAADADAGEEEPVPGDIYDYFDKMDKEEEEGTDVSTVSFEVIQDEIENLQKRLSYDAFYV